MSLLDRIAPWRRKNATLEVFREIYGGKLAKSGVSVTMRDAIRVATVLACARLIAQGVAQVPLKVYRESHSDAGLDVRVSARDHPLYYLLHSSPNRWQTSYEYRETMALHLVLAGAHYSFVNRVSGRVVELIAIEPNRVTVDRADDGTLTYKVSSDKGASQEFPESAIWHVRGLSWNGWQGLDALDLAREAVGLAMSADAAHARMFANGIRPAGVYSVEGKLDSTQYKQLRQFLMDNNAGESSGLPMIVDRGAKWLQHSFSGVDAQHLETRKFQVEEVCRAMGVMPLMVGYSDKTATYASAEQMFLAHVVHTLTPWYTRIEQSIDAHLIGRRDAEQGFYAKFVVAGLLRGAMRDRAEYFSRALGAGGSPAWMTQDEVRALEEMNPVGGDAGRLLSAVPAQGGSDGAS